MSATTEISEVSSAEGAHAPAAAPKAGADAHGQQHPVKLYLTVWLLLFVLSAGSYAIDYFDLHGMLRWTLILLFMVLKAGFIVAIFMHMAWERLALVASILLPPAALGVLLLMMALEGHYTNITRLFYFFAH